MSNWELLGITRTTDKKVIRRAYAKLTKQYHPEEHPEMFQKIRDAYQMAMRYADESIEDMDEQEADIDATYDYTSVWTYEEEEAEEETLSEQKQMTEVFEEVFHEEKDDEVLVDTSLLWRQQIVIAKRLMKGKNKENIYEWTQYLSSDAFQRVKYDINFMHQFYDLCRWSNGSRELFDEILRYYKLSEYEEYLLKQVQKQKVRGDGAMNSKHRLTIDLNEYLLKYDKEGKKEQILLAIKKQWKKMMEEWGFTEWWLCIVFGLVAVLTVIYFFSLLFGVTDLGYREWIDVIFDR